MKEIGGYFQLDQFVNNPYHNNMIELNTGRNALNYIVKAKKIKKLYIPYFLCDSISKVMDKHSIDYEYYNIDKSFKPLFDIELKSNEYLYVVNYYGQMSDDMLVMLKEKVINIIVDNTQSFFQKPIKGIDTIYSCRKYFGLPDGAYLSTDTVLEEEMEYDISSKRMTHILGRFEGKASDYYKDFLENDKSFDELILKNMSTLTKNFLGAIDYDKVIELRNSNFCYLYDRLGETNVLCIKVPYGAFAYPYYIQNGLEIKKKLSEKKIYIPTLWPNVLRYINKSSTEYDYAANILPLPCDQRYSTEDMDYLINELRRIIDEY